MKAIDSSSLAKFLNREENWEKVDEALRGNCISLELSLKETGNSLWKRVHRGLLDSKKAESLFREFVVAPPFTIAEQQTLYSSAFEIAASFDLPVYDSLFLALSKDRKVPLVTSDPSQAEAAKKLGLEVELIL